MLKLKIKSLIFLAIKLIILFFSSAPMQLNLFLI